MQNVKTLDELLAEEEAATATERAADLARYDSPEEVAKREARRQADHEQGVRLGWWDENGDSVVPHDEGEEDEEGDAEDDGQPDEAQEWHDFDPDC